MTHWTRKAGAPLLVALALVSSGCDFEVLNPGQIQDADVNSADLMPILANGVSAEYNDIADNFALDVARLSDEAAGTGSYSETQVFRQGILDWEDTNGDWGTAHEAAWAAEQAWERFQEVLGGSETTTPSAA
jgi:hypothetical protein